MIDKTQLQRKIFFDAESNFRWEYRLEISEKSYIM